MLMCRYKKKLAQQNRHMDPVSPDRFSKRTCKNLQEEEGLRVSIAKGRTGYLLFGLVNFHIPLDLPEILAVAKIKPTDFICLEGRASSFP